MKDNHDDQAWFDALAGRSAPDTSAAREGAALREAVAANEAREAEAQANQAEIPQDALRQAQLLARARREGLIRSRDSALQRFWTVSLGRTFVVAAIAGVAIAFGLYLQSPDPVAPETAEPAFDGVVRDAPDGIVRLEADDPVQLKRQIMEELGAAGVQVTGYELLGRQGIDADLPRPLTDAVRRVLEKHRIAEPADGVLRIEITARGQQQ